MIDDDFYNAAKTVIKKISDEKILIKRYWSNGQLKFKGSYYEMPNELVGKENGKYTWWDENGRIRSKVNYKNGKKDGKSTWFFENGQIHWELNYKDGKKLV